MVVYETAPAKINLSLDVLNKRENGYHEVEMIMTTIDLIDRIELFSLASNEIKVSLESRYVPNDERNLAYQAASAVKQTYDIPFGVHSTTAIARGRGEKIKLLPAPPSCWIVLVKPNVGVSTKEIFQSLTFDQIVHPNTHDVIKALYNANFPQLCEATGNSLEQVTGKLYPEVIQIKEKMMELGCRNVLMSGSGPTVYSLIKQDSKAKRIYNSLCGFCDEAYMVRMLG